MKQLLTMIIVFIAFKASADNIRKDIAEVRAADFADQQEAAATHAANSAAQQAAASAAANLAAQQAANGTLTIRKHVLARRLEANEKELVIRKQAYEEGAQYCKAKNNALPVYKLAQSSFALIGIFSKQCDIFAACSTDSWFISVGVKLEVNCKTK